MEVLPEAILTKPLNNFGSSARRSGQHKRVVVGALLAATSAPAEAQAPQAPEASMTDLVTMRREEKLAREAV